MSVLREERASLPAIGEDTKTQHEVSALLDALHDGGDALPAGVQESLDMLLPRIPIRPVVRRRFYSSDPVLKSHHARSSSSSNGFVDSPTDLRRALLSRSAAAAVAAAASHASNELDFTDLRRLRTQRRTLSETYAKLDPLQAFDASQDNNSVALSSSELSDGCDVRKRVWSTKSRRLSDDHNDGSSYSLSSPSSSLYSSPATTPQSHRSQSVATDTSGNGAESIEKLRNLQKLYQEGFITVTEYKDRRLQLVDELGTPERSASMYL